MRGETMKKIGILLMVLVMAVSTSALSQSQYEAIANAPTEDEAKALIEQFDGQSYGMQPGRFPDELVSVWQGKDVEVEFECIDEEGRRTTFKRRGGSLWASNFEQLAEDGCRPVTMWCHPENTRVDNPMNMGQCGIPLSLADAAGASQMAAALGLTNFQPTYLHPAAPDKEDRVSETGDAGRNLPMTALGNLARMQRAFEEKLFEEAAEREPPREQPGPVIGEPGDGATSEPAEPISGPGRDRPAQPPETAPEDDDCCDRVAELERRVNTMNRQIATLSRQIDSVRQSGAPGATVGRALETGEYEGDTNVALLGAIAGILVVFGIVAFLIVKKF